MQAYSEDLRSRVLKSAVEGMPARQAALRFEVGATTGDDVDAAVPGERRGRGGRARSAARP